MLSFLFKIINRINRKIPVFSTDIEHWRDFKNFKRDTFFEIIRYGIMGVINTLIYAAAGIMLHRLLDMPALQANLIAIVISIVTGFIGHNFFTYRQKKMQLASFVRFIVVQTLALCVSQSIVYIVVHVLGLVYETALLVSIAVLPPLVWGLGHVWVFRGAKKTSPEHK